MAKEFNIFFSWQADLPSGQTKSFIENVLSDVRNDLQPDIIVNIDEATRNTFGSPDIVQSIFEKIEQADLFVADISIVGKYEVQKRDEDEDPLYKFIPNSNVMLELGYAAGTISWDRMICLANTKYGEISKLPFDLNHRRVTGYSFDQDSKRKERKRIAQIIAGTIKEYINNPIPKKNFSHHIVGGYDLNKEQIVNTIVPFNDFTLLRFGKKTTVLIEQAENLIKQISIIHLVHKLVEPEIEIPEDTTISEIKSNPEYSKAFSAKFSLFTTRDAKINREMLTKDIQAYCKAEISEDFFDLGDLKISVSTTPILGSSLEGTDEEKKKYEFFGELEGIFGELDLRQMYLEVFSDVYIIPLAIQNISQKNDERIEVILKIKEGEAVRPTADFFPKEYVGLEGAVHDYKLVDELLKLPESSKIKADSSFSFPIDTPVPHFHMPHMDVFGNFSEPDSTEEDYEEELQGFVQDLDEGTLNEYTFSIGALRPGELLWFDKVVLVRPVDKRITIEYSIKSNNTTGNINGTLEFMENE